MRTKWSLAALVLCLASAVRAADTVEIQPHASPGQRWNFQSLTDLDMKVKYTAAGQTQEAAQKMNEVVKGTATVLKAVNGQATVLRVQFADDCGGKMDGGNGQVQEKKSSFAGATITIRREADGSVSHDGKEIAEADEKTLKSMLDHNASLYPRKPVTVGDSWDADPAAVARQFGLDANSKATANYTLKKVQSRDGHNLALVDANITAAHKEGPIDIKITAKGTMTVDLATGEVVVGELSGNIDSDGLVTQNNPQTNEQVIVQVIGTGTAGFHTTIEPLGGAGGGADVPPYNPEPGAGPGDSVAGRFEGESISIDLTKAGDAYGGSIHMGDKTFPLKAKKDGDNLKGAFQSDGDTFDFTAAIDGPTMKFSTGGTDYTLKKKAANPFSRPKKPNPLGGGTGSGAAHPPPADVAPDVEANADAPKPPARAHAGSGDMLRFQRYSLKDDKVIPGEASSFLIPAGWQVTGGIQWRTHIYYPTFVDMQIRNPDGIEALYLLPAVPCMWSQQPMLGFPPGSIYGGSLVRRPGPPAEFIRDIVLPYLRKPLQSAEVVKTEDLPDLARTALASNAQEAGIEKTAQAARVRFRYEENGVPIEEDVYCALVYARGLQTGLAFFNPDICFSFRAKAGTLDDRSRILKVIQSSVRPNLNWFNRLSQIIQIRHDAGMQAIHDVGEWSKMYAKTSGEISDSITSSYWKTQAVQDKVNHNISQSIRGLETFADDAGRTYDLPNTYGNAWVNNRGEIIVSADSSYDPGVELKEDWKRLQPRQ